MRPLCSYLRSSGSDGHLPVAVRRRRRRRRPHSTRVYAHRVVMKHRHRVTTKTAMPSNSRPTRHGHAPLEPTVNCAWSLTPSYYRCVIAVMIAISRSVRVAAWNANVYDAGRRDVRVALAFLCGVDAFPDK